MADTERTEHTERMIVRELRQQLAANRTLLMRHEELLGALKVPMSEMRDYRLLERTLRDTPIGDWMLAADQGDAAARAKARERAIQALMEQGMQVQAAERVVSLLTESLDWDKPQGAPAMTPPTANPVPPTAGPVPPTVNPVPPVAKPETAAVWNCVCGQTGNKGEFCIKCGRPRPQGTPAMTPPAADPVPPTAGTVPPIVNPVQPVAKPETTAVWNCVCGQTGNKGEFCIKCGRPRPQGEVQNPAPVPPASRASHPVPPASPATGAGSGQPWPVQGRPAPQPQPQPYAGAQPAAGKGKNLRIVALVAVIVVLAGTLVFFGMRALGGREDSSVASQTTSENGNELKEVKPGKKDKSQPAAQPAAQQRAMKTELSLGGLDLGDPINVINEVEKGKKPNDTRNDGKLVRYYFDNMQIVTQGNEVAALVSNDNKVTTKRGIHQGSTFAEVKNAYGSTYYKTGLGGSLTAIEYEAKTANGRRGLLRFAINDNTHKVDYISVRLMQ